MPELLNSATADIGAVTAEQLKKVADEAYEINGHVIVVYPGAAKPAGGYAYTSGGKSQTMRARGSYPLAMSTSLGGWAGAKSKGDKTIWDPWANDGKFAEVKFWRLDTGAAK